MVNHARRKLPPPRTVRCLGPGPEHVFTSRDGERVCPGCRKRERERDGHLITTNSPTRPGRIRLVVSPTGVTGALRWAEGRDYHAVGCAGNQGAGTSTLRRLKARAAVVGVRDPGPVPTHDGTHAAAARASAAKGGRATRGVRKQRRSA